MGLETLRLVSEVQTVSVFAFPACARARLVRSHITENTALNPFASTTAVCVAVSSITCQRPAGDMMRG